MPTKTSEKTQPRPRAKEKACDRAIQRTLTYSSIFKYPMSKFQIYSFLITKNKFDEEFFEKSLRRLIKKGHIKTKGRKYYLSGVRPVSWSLRNKYSQELIQENLTILKLLAKIPWINMIAITGAVAANNASKDDDLDIFIVTKKDRIWITRFFVFCILKATKKYAHNKDTERKICANLYLDQTSLEWDKKKHSLYIAYEIMSMHPIFDRNNTYFKFIKANSWINNHFRNLNIEFPEKESKLKKGGVLINLVENIFKAAQIKYMRKNITTETAAKNLIHFNKNDHTNMILKNYAELVEKI